MIVKRKKFEEGGLIGEEELFNDDLDTPGETGGVLEGERTGEDPPLPGETAGEPPAPITGTEGGEGGEGEEGDGTPPEPIPDTVDLTGIEQFLTNYGVQGGVIEFEDGSTSRFSELGEPEQAEILTSLVNESVPSIEEKYNLDEREINLINVIRESGQGVEDFINNITDYRLQTVLAQRDANSVDFNALSDDAMFVKHLNDTKSELSDEQVAQELVSAKDLLTYKETVDRIRDSYQAVQDKDVQKVTSESNAEFGRELEEQRTVIVEAVQNIGDIAGAEITDDMKEYLLHDIMELNDNKDPILMEKLFSDPEVMFKANWFANYGEDYITNLNDYWKKEVSRAHKTGYQKALGQLPDNPSIIEGTGTPGKNGKNAKTNEAPYPGGFGTIVSEEELFDET